MEQIAKIELVGIIGRVNLSEVGDTKMARFSLATNYCYKSKDGIPVIETQWFSVIAYPGPKIAALESLDRGKSVHVIGRVRMQRYLDASGNDRSSWDVIAQELKLVEG